VGIRRDRIRSVDPARSVFVDYSIAVGRAGAPGVILSAQPLANNYDGFMMVAAMMTAMMGNDNHLMVEGHQRLYDRYARRGKKYSKCN